MEYQKKIWWFFKIVMPQLLIVLALYATTAYVIVTNEMAKKEQEELKMELDWKAAQPANSTEKMPKFEYYDYKNWLLINYYPLMTTCAQGFSFLLSTTYHWIPYRWWSLVGFIVHATCFPVDILIFYVEPFGPIGTLASQVFAFIPFYIITASAIFPEEEGYVDTPNGIKKKKLNSLTEHISFSYNMRYRYVLSWTWDGYKFFSTVALCLYLLQGTPEQAFLGIVIVPLECFPQFLICAMNATHWDSEYRRDALNFFSTVVDIPLSIWYLTFYPDPSTKSVVVAKILVDSVHNTCYAYKDFIETYLYYEKPIEILNEDDLNKQKKVNNYDNRYPLTVLFYNSLYVCLSPFIALQEIGIAGKNSVLTRDLGLFQEIKVRQEPREVWTAETDQ